MSAQDVDPVLTESVVREWSMDYTMVYGVVSLARIHARRYLTLMDWRGDAESAVLMVSELVSNAIDHGRIPGHLLTVRLAIHESERLVIDVSDPVDSFPKFGEVIEPGPDDESGRGLLMVRHFGGRLSWYPRHDYGKTVRVLVEPGVEVL
ncbi:ATP-binding protein [Streptomyces sp. NPDC102274]|uniref:ATP-binding protein n=1 Tax=Streptomyces sp. NPDC102274 TaxID=3366151 RepID=UPI0037FCDCD0